MIDLSPLLWVLVFAVSASAAAIQGTVGIGYGLVSVPILELIDPALAPVPQLLTVIPLTIAMVWKERHAIDLTGVGWLVGGRVPGAAIGVALLAVATQRTLDLFIGAVVLLAVAVIGSGFTVRTTPATQFGAGVASGVTSLVASIGGPPTALLYTREEAATIRATLAGVFTIGVLLSVAVRFSTGNFTDVDLKLSLALVPAVVVGWAASSRHKDRFSQRHIRLGVLAVSGAAAVGLMVRAIV